MLLAAGITAWILVQAFVNIGAVVGVLPITGVPLPFVSFGGSSLLVLMAAAGLLLNVARHERPSSRREVMERVDAHVRAGWPVAARPATSCRAWPWRPRSSTRGHAPDRSSSSAASGASRTRLVPDAGYPLVALPGRGIQRRFTWRTSTAVLGILRGVVQGIGLVRRTAAAGGRRRRRLRQRGVHGRRGPVARAHRRDRAERSCRRGQPTGRPVRQGRRGPVPRLRPAAQVVTGNPVRPEILAIDRAAIATRRARRSACPPTGWSSRCSAARSGRGPSTTRFAAAAAVARPRDVAIRHVVGTRDWDELGAAARAARRRACCTKRCATRTAWTCCSPRPTWR